MLYRCLARCSTAALAIAVMCWPTAADWSSDRQGYSTPMTCRSYMTLVDLLPDPKVMGQPGDPEHFNAFKNYIRNAPTPQSLHQAENPFAQIGVPPACMAKREPSQPQDGFRRKLEETTRPENQENHGTTLGYLYSEPSLASAAFGFRSGPVVQKFAGMGVAAVNEEMTTLGDPRLTFFDSPTGTAIDYATGDMYVADSGMNRIQKLTKLHGYNVTILFNGSWQNVTEAERVVEMSFMTPTAVAFHGGYLYASDEDNSRIVRINTTDSNGNPLTSDLQTEKTVVVVANTNGIRGMAGDCGPATLARFRKVRSMTIIPAHANKPLMIGMADSGNNRIRFMSITDWPTCIDTTGYDCKTSATVIDYKGTGPTTGKLCASGSDCGFTVTSPDECAFICKHYGTGNYPIKLPEVEYELTGDQIKQLLAGCPSGSADGTLMHCTTMSILTAKQQKTMVLESQLPRQKAVYTMRKNLTLSGGVTVPENYKLLGAVVGGRLRPLNYSELDEKSWRGISKAKFRFGIVSSLTCNSWSFNYVTTGLTEFPTSGGAFIAYLKPTDSLTRTGKCYLLSGGLSGCKTGGQDIAGTASCRPGKIETVLGSGAPGLPADSSPAGQKVKQNALRTRLQRPSGMAILNSGEQLAPMQDEVPRLMMMVSDTANQRLVSKPLLPHNVYIAHFWMFIAGENVVDFVNTNIDTTIGWSVRGALGWMNTYNVVKFAEMAKDSESGVLQEHDVCDLDGTRNFEFRYGAMAQFSRQISKYCASNLCPNARVLEALGFSSSSTGYQCCKHFCESLLNQCMFPILAARAAMGSVKTCESFYEVKTCMNKNMSAHLPSNSAGCYNTSAGGGIEPDEVLTRVLGISNATNLTLLEETCEGTTAGDAMTCTGGMCDLKMADILGVNQEWVRANDTNKQLVGILYEVEVYDRNEYIRLTQALSAMKREEYKIMQDSTTNNIPYPSTYNDRAQWGPGSTIFVFMSFWYLLTELAGYTQNAFKVTFSATSGYDAYTPDNFGTIRTVDSTNAYWSLGTGVPGNSVGTRGLSTTDTSLNFPGGMVFDRAQIGYLADVQNFRVLRMNHIWSSQGSTVKVAGNGYSSFNGNGMLASMTGLLLPTYLSHDSSGSLVVTDSKHHELREVQGLVWKRKCMYSDQYWQLLTSPTSDQKMQISNLLKCRDSQVRVLILNMIEECRKWHLATAAKLATASSMSSMFCRPPGTLPETYNDLNGQLRNEIFAVSPDCALCDSSGVETNLTLLCHSKEANLYWNNTVDSWGKDTSNVTATTKIRVSDILRDASDDDNYKVDSDQFAPAGDSMLWELTYYLNDETVEVLLKTVQNSVDRINGGEEPWTTPSGSNNGKNQLALHLEDIINASRDEGDHKVRTMVNVLRTKICDGINSSPMTRLLLYQWYLQVVNSCMIVPDSQASLRAGLIGGQFYDSRSVMLTVLFGNVVDLQTGTSISSPCHPGCNLLHPRFYGNLPWLYPPGTSPPSLESDDGMVRWSIVPAGPRFGRCCGYAGYRCTAGEGPCQHQQDCSGGMACVKDSCFWGKGESCCQKADENSMEVVATQIARTIGYDDLMLLKGTVLKY